MSCGPHSLGDLWWGAAPSGGCAGSPPLTAKTEEKLYMLILKHLTDFCTFIKASFSPAVSRAN